MYLDPVRTYLSICKYLCDHLQLYPKPPNRENKQQQPCLCWPVVVSTKMTTSQHTKSPSPPETGLCGMVVTFTCFTDHSTFNTFGIILQTLPYNLFIFTKLQGSSHWHIFRWYVLSCKIEELTLLADTCQFLPFVRSGLTKFRLIFTISSIAK